MTGGWSTGNKPRVLHHGGHTYIGWVDGATGDVGVDDWTMATFSPPDLHDAPGFVVDPDDGHVLAFYCSHSDDRVRMRDVTAKGSEQIVLTGAGPYTYCSPFVWDGKLRVLVRSGVDSTGWLGNEWTLATRDGTWSSIVLAYEESRSIYLQPSVSSGRVDFGMGNHPTHHADAHIWHFYLDATGYHKSDGTPMGSPPFGEADMTKIYGDSRSFLFDVDGPAVGFVAMDDAWVDQRYHVWDGLMHDVGPAGDGLAENGTGVGGLALDWPRAYVSRQGPGGGWHIHEWPSGRHLGPGMFPVVADRAYWLTGRYDSYLDYRLMVAADLPSGLPGPPGATGPPGPSSELIIDDSGAEPPVPVYGDDADFVYSG